MKKPKSHAVNNENQNYYQAKTKSMQWIIWADPEASPRQCDQEDTGSVDFSGEEIDMRTEW